MLKLIYTSIFALLIGETVSAQNLLNLQEWVPGTGGTASFTTNGLANENSREWGIAPDGSRAVLWKATPSGDSQGDGGWNTSPVTINRQLMYRFSVWMKKTNSKSGTSYLGCSNGASIVTELNGSATTNPYFWYGALPILDRWYLIVGYIHGVDDTSTVNMGGIYDGVTGAKVVTCTDFKFTPTASTIYHRSYLYYDPNVNDRQYFYAPRLELVNGNEPSIAALLNISGNNGGSGYLSSLGVGTTSIPSGYKLAVGGKAIAEEIKVKLQSSGWPDYVFDSSYKLSPLTETAQFIKNNKRLPGIPSAKEVGEKGLELGQNQALLLEKIEELTLYIIDQDKQMKNCRQELTELERSLKQIEKRGKDQ